MFSSICAGVVDNALLASLAVTAFFARETLCSLVREFALAIPPSDPSACACGFLDIYHSLNGVVIAVEWIHLLRLL